MYFLWASIFTLLLLGAWVLTIAGLPGNWLILTLTALFYFFIPQNGLAPFGISVLLALGVLAAVGEILEFGLSAMGIKKGGSKKGALFAVIGSFLGCFLGAVILGPVGMILFAGLGAMGGAILGERSLGKDMGKSLEIGKAAFWGRILGSLSKLLIGGVMLAIASVASFL